MLTDLVEVKLDNYSRPILPRGLEYIKDYEGQNYTIEKVSDHVSRFGNQVASEIYNELQKGEHEKVRIVIPISGGMVAYNSLLSALKSYGVSANQLEIVYASNSAEGYRLSKNIDIQMTTFLLDDIYDSGDSFREIFRLFYPDESDLSTKPDFKARYLSTKLGCILPEECISEPLTMDVLPRLWMANPYSMNSNINGIDPDTGEVVNPYLLLMAKEIEFLERVTGIPIAVSDLSVVNTWTQTEVDYYIQVLKHKAMAFFKTIEETSLFTSIFKKIKEIKIEGDIEKLFQYLNRDVTSLTFANAGLIS